LQTPHPESTDHITVQIDRDLEDIVPGFLANRRRDIQTLRHALADKDFGTIQMLGHRMSGDGGGYGLDQISEIGGALELAAAQQDYATSKRHIMQLEDFLTHVRIEYR
jgi:HPt (histidine-containing phosphotransfer) domain-containing protein